MDHAGGSSSGGGGAPESNWPQSLDKPLTQELYNFGLLVPSGCRLAKPWRICKDGYPALDNPATPEQLRVHPGGRYNTRGRHAYWDGKNYNGVITRRRRHPTSPSGGDPPPTSGGPGGGPSVPAEYEVPPEQFVLREDGDPDDSPGLLVAIRASQATAAAVAREETEIAAAIQATEAAAAVGANPPPVGDDDDVDWDALANSSDDDDDGGDGIGAVDEPAVVYLDSD
ncbi:hypothetical protein D1007_37200 [Hordeum vulgare]|nr:hypothetical protein D1007_37200 [Hordeum vulgare]